MKEANNGDNRSSKIRQAEAFEVMSQITSSTKSAISIPRWWYVCGTMSTAYDMSDNYFIIVDRFTDEKNYNINHWGNQLKELYEHKDKISDSQIQHISKIKNETEETVASLTSKNFFKLFNIKIKKWNLLF